MNHAATSGTKPSGPGPADTVRAASAAYSSVAPSTAAVTTAAGIDSRLGSRRTRKYIASPSITPSGSGMLPPAMTSGVRGGRDGQHRQRPAPQRHDEGAGHQRDE